MGRPKAVQTSFWGTLGKALLSKTAIVIVALVAQAALLIWLVIDLSQYAAYVYAGFLVLSALVILYVVNRDDNPDFKLVWMVPIAALPVVGAVIYLFVRLQLGTRLIRRRIDASEAAAAEVRPRDENAVAAVRALSAARPSPAIWKSAAFRRTSIPTAPITASGMRCSPTCCAPSKTRANSSFWSISF